MALAKAHKYRAVTTIVDGISFRSKKEARRYATLKFMEKSRLISNLVLQPRFKIEINGKHICDYYADFGYDDTIGTAVIEDTKGFKTPLYRLKKKLVEASFNIKILET